MKQKLAIILWLIAIALWMQNYQLNTTRLNLPEPYRSLYEEMLAPVVKVKTGAGIGSGVIISSEDGKTYILTAAHVVGDENEVQVIIYSYSRQGGTEFAEIIKATVVITDTNKDLALLHTPNPSQEGNNSPLTRGGWGCVAKLAPRNYKPYLFTEVYAVGCSLGFNPRPSEGIVSAVSNTEWEISSPILPGNSGGGVFLKDTHQLIGITVWVRVYHGQLITTMAGIVPIHEIYDFLDGYKRTKELKNEGTTKFFRFSVLPFFSAKQRTTSVVPRGGLGADLTCWSDRGSECAIGTGGPAGQPYL